MDRTPAESAGVGAGSLASYTVGFLLSVVLTAAAFALVIGGRGLSRGVVLPGITALAVLQILVHLRCFLHMDGSSSGRWNLMALIFTVLIMALFVVGTLWIMTDLDFRMM